MKKRIFNKFPLIPCDVCGEDFGRKFEHQIICGKYCRAAREEAESILREIDNKIKILYSMK